ncbi:export protein [Salmonella enterica subsp. arizonae]|uniref:Export protein n=1 Tax=Salmonella enterica subsp. arizonae TaxID=59203 RepID=A0A447R2Z7_SALER|nr:export protein [Salmonella enterica subsp. arizonae]
MEKTRADGLPLPQRYGAILTIIIGISMAVLDGAIANVALPTIATDLHASPASSIWIVNAYQIAIVVSLLSLSFLGDMFGYRRIYKCGLVVFLLSSLFCALSDSLQMLTLARIAQGFGGAALMSVNTALIRLIYPSVIWDEAWELTLLSSLSLPPLVQQSPRRSCPSHHGNGCF